MNEKEKYKIDNAPIEGCSGCQMTAGRWGCPKHSPNVYVLEPTLNPYPGDGMGGDVKSEKENWEKEFEEEWEHEHPSGVHPEGCLCQACEWENETKPEAKRWYLQACRVRQEEIERLTEERNYYRNLLSLEAKLREAP